MAHSPVTYHSHVPCEAAHSATGLRPTLRSIMALWTVSEGFVLAMVPLEVVSSAPLDAKHWGTQHPSVLEIASTALLEIPTALVRNGLLQGPVAETPRTDGLSPSRGLCVQFGLPTLTRQSKPPRPFAIPTKTSTTFEGKANDRHSANQPSPAPRRQSSSRDHAQRLLVSKPLAIATNRNLSYSGSRATVGSCALARRVLLFAIASSHVTLAREEGRTPWSVCHARRQPEYSQFRPPASLHLVFTAASKGTPAGFRHRRRGPRRGRRRRVCV